MLIERNVFEIMPGCMDEAIAILKAEGANSPKQSRILIHALGGFDQVIAEIKFESLDDADKFWTNWQETGAGEKFSKLFDPLITSHGYRQIWAVHEPIESAKTGKYVDWRFCNVKPGHAAEVLKLLTENRAESKRYDILVPIYGPMQQVAFVLEFDSFDAYQQEWTDWGNQKTTPDFMQAWHQVVSPGSENEVYKVI